MVCFDALKQRLAACHAPSLVTSGGGSRGDGQHNEALTMRERLERMRRRLTAALAVDRSLRALNARKEWLIKVEDSLEVFESMVRPCVFLSVSLSLPRTDFHPLHKMVRFSHPLYHVSAFPLPPSLPPSLSLSLSLSLSCRHVRVRVLKVLLVGFSFSLDTIYEQINAYTNGASSDAARAGFFLALALAVLEIVLIGKQVVNVYSMMDKMRGSDERRTSSVVARRSVLSSVAGQARRSMRSTLPADRLQARLRFTTKRFNAASPDGHLWSLDGRPPCGLQRCCRRLSLSLPRARMTQLATQRRSRTARSPAAAAARPERT